MKVLLASKFLHHVGGVETYIAWLARHLPLHGVELAFFGMRPPAGASVMEQLDGPVYLSPNRDFHGSTLRKGVSAAASVYSFAARAAMEEAVDEFKPDLVHFQSTCYQLTPSVVAAVDRRGIPMVTTAHEYKFVCSNQRLWDDGAGRPCTRCLDSSTVRRMGHVTRTKCVKGGLASSVVAALELPVSQTVWRRTSGLVHAPSRYMAELLEGGGSPVAGRVRYLDLAWGTAIDPGCPGSGPRTDVTYIGRLSVEKGVDTLLRAWPTVLAAHPHARLRLFGTGNDEARLHGLARGLGNVDFPGRYELSQLPAILRASAMTVHPSTWAENSPYTVRESLQHGVPAIVTDQGGLPEMVGPRSGTVVPASDATAMAAAIIDELRAPRAGTRELVDAVRDRAVTDEQHVEALLSLYGDSLTRGRRA